MTIKRKLMLIIMLTCTIALLLAGILNLSHHYIKIRKELILNTSCYAKIIGENCRAAIFFKDEKDASEMLKSLDAESSIVFACIYTKEGKVLAHYKRADITEDIPAPPCAKENYWFDKHYFRLFNGIDSGDEIIGTVYIQLDTSEMKARLQMEVGIKILFVLVCSIIAYLISSRLQRIISGPIVDLAKVVKGISEKKGYSTRAPKRNNDEVGSFIDAFNVMLEQIQQSDSDLREARDKLEERVAKRTAELTHTNEQLSREVDERKKAEDALRESEERFRIAINATKDGIWEWDIQTHQEFFSPRWCEIIGYSFDDPELPHTYNSWESRIHPDDHDRVLIAMTNHLEKGTRYDVEYRHRHKSGEYRWQGSKGQAVLDESGKPIKMVGSIFDITERKQNEEKIKVFSDAVAGAFDFFLLTDLKGNITYANESVIRAFGYTPEEFLKLNISKLNADQEVVKEVMQELAAKGKWSGEVRTIRKNGEEFPTLLSASFIKDDEGNPKGMMGILKDITELKQAEETLRKSENKYRTLIENLPQRIFAKDRDSIYVSCNENYAQDLGIRPEKLKGKTDYDFYSKELAEKYRQDDKRIMETGRTENIEEKYIWKGQEMIVQTVKTPIKDKQGNVNGVLGIFWDITDLKHAQEELQKTQERLLEASHKAGMAEVATDVLHNVGNVLNSINVSTTLITEKIAKSELANVQKVASIINEHIDEIGTFLTEHSQGKHIPTYLAEVSKCLQAEQTDIIGKLHVLADNVQHIKDIISMQQAYAKVSGVLVQMSPSQLVEDAIQINSAGLQRHGTRLVREFQELPDIEIDKQRVLPIMVNLISNAKYALSGSDKEDKLLTIRINRRGEDRFRIEVADNGAGIPKENLTKIFSHGFTTKQHGHGFGLHSSALAANELGGSLTVHSDGLGKGARFTLELPFKSARVTQ
jgi:PAS domain S-box-containing protein